MSWQPPPEELVSFAPGADKRYRDQVDSLRALGRGEIVSRSDASEYAPWPHLVGRGEHGEFPLIVVREHYRRQGYTVWFCEPALEICGDPDFVGFMLLSYSGRRVPAHPAYRRMQTLFGESTIDRLNLEADRAKVQMNDGRGNRGGGDPDLFVFKAHERFFVEVKWKDHLSAKQRVTFPLIERHCGIKLKIVRIVAGGKLSKEQPGA